MHNSIIKLVDIALVPAGLMVISKLVGLILTLTVFSIPWSVQQLSETIFTVRPAVPTTEILTASTYSDAFLLICMGVGFSFVIIQATRFHETHISPRLLVQLSNHNLLGLIKSSFDIYHTAAIWLIFVWASLGTVWINIATGKTEVWLGILGLIINIVLTSVLLQDVYAEIDLTKRNIGDLEALS